MLRSSLEETRRYRVFSAADEATAVIQLRSQGCTIAFIDLDIGVDVTLQIGRALRSAKPDLELTIFSDEETPPALDSLRPWTLLRKPFYMPEFMKSVTPAEPAEAPASAPPSVPEA